MSFVLPVDDTLSLRLVEPRHAEELFAVIDRNRAHLDAWMPWAEPTKTADDTRRWASEACRKFGEQTDLPLTILEGGEVVGGIGLHHLDSPHRSAELGYWLAADREGRGIVTRAARFVIGYGFREYALRRVYVNADTRNTRSRAVAERLGMRQEAEFKQGLKTHHGDFRDNAVYAVLDDEWKARR